MNRKWREKVIIVVSDEATEFEELLNKELDILFMSSSKDGRVNEIKIFPSSEFKYAAAILYCDLIEV